MTSQQLDNAITEAFNSIPVEGATVKSAFTIGYLKGRLLGLKQGMEAIDSARKAARESQQCERCERPALLTGELCSQHDSECEVGECEGVKAEGDSYCTDCRAVAEDNRRIFRGGVLAGMVEGR